MEGDELMEMITDNLKVCPHCGAAVPLDAGAAHLQWHDNLEAILDRVVTNGLPKPKDLPLAKVLTLVKETND
jgi:hypothetical protein